MIFNPNHTTLDYYNGYFKHFDYARLDKNGWGRWENLPMDIKRIRNDLNIYYRIEDKELEQEMKRLNHN